MLLQPRGVIMVFEKLAPKQRDLFRRAIVKIGDWLHKLWSPAKFKGANKDAKIYVERSTTVQNRLFWAQTLCTTDVTKRFYWLVSQSQVNNYCVLCMVKVEKANKNIQQRTLLKPLYLQWPDQLKIYLIGVPNWPLLSGSCPGPWSFSTIFWQEKNSTWSAVDRYLPISILAL